MKLLSPAGNIQSLKAAIYNGADEIYLGINDFNARNNVNGFTLQTLEEGVNFAHLYGVRVFLAVNILFNDNELQNVVKTVVESANLGIDAFIMQDLGLISIIRKNYPLIEIHASTQMGIHNLEGVKFLEKLGIKRVVLSRETPLPEVKRIKKNSNIEIEYFVQGALCVSFSGNCYMSSKLCSASGNRGLCKQLCRLPFTLKKNNKTLKHGYLLSAKDFCLIDRLSVLKEAGVDSIKIEGRARRAYYVAVTTREYRKALNGEPFDKNKLSLAFNRLFAQGYFNENGNIISPFNNHIGIEIGKVLSFEHGKKFNKAVISSNRELSAKSTFKFFNGLKENNTLTAYDLTKTANGYSLTTTQTLNINDTVRLISDYRNEQEVLSFSKKRNIDLDVYLLENQPLKAVFSVNGKVHTVTGDLCLKALNSPLSEQEVLSCFSKHPVFNGKVNLTLENVFVAKSTLNEFRRNVFSQVENAILSCYLKNYELCEIALPKSVLPLEDFEFTTRADGIFNAQTVIYSPSEYSVKNVETFKNNCLSQNKNPYLELPNFALKEDIEVIKEILKATKIGIVANNYYAFELSENVLIGGGLNVYNSVSSRFFNRPYLSYEKNHSPKTTLPYMTLLHCPIKTHVGGNCDNCKYQEGFVFVADNKKRFKLTRKKISSCVFYLED